MGEFTWHYVKTEGNPKRSGTYIIAVSSNNTSTLGDYQGGKWYFHAYETENGNPLEMAPPYAWAKFPKAPAKE